MRLSSPPVPACLFALLLLSGCDPGIIESSSGASGPTTAGSTPGGPTGSTTPGGFKGNPGGPSGTKDTVVVTPSVGGTVSVASGSTETVSVTFTSSDGRMISGLAISGTTLPADWSGIDNYSCTLVGSGSSCVANLTYAPTSVGTGTLTLAYVYIDNANEPQAPGGSLVIPFAATTYNNVVASIAPTGQVNAVPGGGSQPVSINFTTDDGNAATGLAITSDLANLPAGWSTATTGFSCAIVSTGSGCQLALSYAPGSAASGTLALNYTYTDDSGAPRTGTANIPYSAATSGNIVATVAPTGQINAVQKTGRQPVTITFTTDDGKPATGFRLQSNLTALPAGWSSASGGLTCGSVSTGNGCQLNLTYAPTAIARGTFSLSYDYFDAVGTYSVGSVNVEYAATTNDNVVGTAAPSGQVNAIVGLGSQSVTATFTTDDGRPATALQLTTNLAMLPPGWSSTDSTFACSGVSSGSGCQLPLAYVPPVAASGSLTLTYRYLNDAGQSKMGTMSIPYRATTDDNVAGSANPSPISVQAGSANPVTVTFTTDDGNLASGLSVISGLATLPAGWTSSSGGAFNCATLASGTGCQLALTYAPPLPDTGTLTLGFTYTNNSGFVKSGTVAIPYTATP